MSNKRKQNTYWLSKVVNEKSNEWKLNMVVQVNGHLKIIFTHEDGRKWILCTSNTSSDVNVRKNQISLIRRGFKENFDIEVERNDFSMQLYRGKDGNIF